MKSAASFCSVLLFLSERIWARAGGAGGGHSGGGFGGGGFGGGHVGGFSGGGNYGTVNLDSSSDNFGALVILVLLVLAFLYAIRRQRDPDRSSRIQSFPGLKPFQPVVDLSVLADEGLPSFQKKVESAFLTIQKAWSEKRLDPMRRFITDGVYQRFHAQMTMMNLLEQTNIISNVEVQSIQLVKIYKDGVYDCIDVRILAEADDQFVCKKFPQLNSPGGREAFTEFWSFIRRRDHKPGLNIFSSENCPQCSAPLTGKLLETARCPYCSSYLNSGEFDWVLSEITQEADYNRNFRAEFNLPPLISTPVAEVLEHFPGFSKQVLEDRASNAFMQILIAMATHNSQALQKFSTPEAFQLLTQMIPKGHLVYDRLYTRSADLISLQLQGNKITAYVGIEYSTHVIILEDPTTHFFNSNVQTPHSAVLALTREISSLTAKGSVYAGSCPHCGAPQKSGLSPVCEYCSGSLNDPRLDWIVEDLMDLRKFRSLPGVFATGAS